ncbi:MAG: fatty acid desaturase [Alphaproteobacteria bacterium]
MYENAAMRVDNQSDKSSVERNQNQSQVKAKDTVRELVDHCSKYQESDNRKASLQVVNTLVPFFALCALMLYSFPHAYWLTALLTPLASFLLVRIFIIQHDCGHGSFFTKRKWNNRVGRFMSLLTWTPYDFWRKTHNMHHSGSGNLDNRGFGAIETITVAEYEALSPKMKFLYRAYRNPYIMLLFGTPFFIIIGQRIPNAEPFPFYEAKKTVSLKQIWKSVFGLNAALMMVFGVLGMFFGLAPVLLTYIPVVVGTSWIGGWLFYIQHQFEDAHWANQDDWDYHEAAVMGSSYYDLHPIMHWLTGNIGLHHIHHLNLKIPNYRLHECLNDNDDLREINRIGFLESFKYAKLALWDEKQNKMIPF